MKKAIIIIYCIIFSFLANAQECDFAKNEKDEFTGEQVKETISTHLIRGFGEPEVFIKFRKINSTYFLILNYNESNETHISVGLNDRLMLKLEDSSILFFSPTETATGIINSSKYTNIFIKYSATITQINKLANFGVAKSRITFTSRNISSDIKTRNKTDIKQAAACVLN